jgi:hypothetical protein
MKLLICLLPTLFLSMETAAQSVVVNDQQYFKNDVPAGNYSGITCIGKNEYAVVSDKSDQDGFFVFRIDIDSVTGLIKEVKNEGFRGSGQNQLDEEGIAYLPDLRTVMISCEKDSKLREYQLDGNRTIRELQLQTGVGNYGYESLTYQPKTQTLWTCTESTLPGDGQQASQQTPVSNRLRLQAIDKDLHPGNQYAYEMDKPVADTPAEYYAMGVSELLALEDGSLLVLEREFMVPSSKLGAFVNCKIYRVKPTDAYKISAHEALTEHTKYLPKQLLTTWRTSLSLFNRSIANYEGMCLGPRLASGQQVVICVADSQNQYAGVLRDWFRTLLLDAHLPNP